MANLLTCFKKKQSFFRHSCMWVALLLQSGRTIRFTPGPGPANIHIPSIPNMDTRCKWARPLHPPTLMLGLAASASTNLAARSARRTYVEEELLRASFVYSHVRSTYQSLITSSHARARASQLISSALYENNI
jgi:hypothetical protein